MRCLCLVVVLAALLVFAGCGKKAAQPPATEAPSESAPPPPQPAPNDKPGANIDGFVWGFIYSDQDDDKWQDELLARLKTDIKWGLEESKPSKKDMVLVPAGEAVFGCEEPPRTPQECLPFQKRQVEAFYIDRTETTNADYARCVEAKLCLPPHNHPTMPDFLADDRPALLTYKQAERYCLWLGKRLPTEYEWEKAARGTDGRLYTWGDGEPDDAFANICGLDCTMEWAAAGWKDGYAYTAPVGSFSRGAGPYRLLDMAGNVKEWTISVEELAEYHFIAHGSSWYSDTPELYAFYRQVWEPGVRVDDKGVRCVLDVH